MVLAVSHRISPVPRYSGYTLCRKSLRIRGFHPLWLAFPCNSTSYLSTTSYVLQPLQCRNITGLGFFPFARHYLGNHYCFLLLRVLRCFSSPRLLSTFVEYLVFNKIGCPIRISMDQRSLAPPHSFSQLTTSFFASESLGIPHAPLIISRSLYCFWYSPLSMNAVVSQRIQLEISLDTIQMTLSMATYLCASIIYLCKLFSVCCCQLIFG